MKPIFIAFLLLSSALISQEAPIPLEKATAATMTKDFDKSILVIEPKARSSDYAQAFELLRKDKPSMKIMLRTKNSPPITISELTPSAQGTLLFTKVASNTGSKYLIVPIEEVLEIGYSPN